MYEERQFIECTKCGHDIPVMGTIDIPKECKCGNNEFKIIKKTLYKVTINKVVGVAHKEIWATSPEEAEDKINFDECDFMDVPIWYSLTDVEPKFKSMGGRYA